MKYIKNMMYDNGVPTFRDFAKCIGVIAKSENEAEKACKLFAKERCMTIGELIKGCMEMLPPRWEYHQVGEYDYDYKDDMSHQ